MTLKSFIVILIFFCARSCETSDIFCQLYKLHYGGGLVITYDEKTESIEYHCDTSDNVTRVELKYFSGDHFPNEIFEKYPNLVQIVIRLENNFNVLNENFFTGEIQTKIKRLEIDAATGFKPKYLEKLEVDFISKFPEVYDLKINGFNFGTVEKFKFNEKLTELWLYKNQIKKLQKDSFSNLPNLELLDLSKNEIQILNPTLLEKNVNLKKILFHNNQIKEIPRNFFSGLIVLEEISFISNDIEFLHEDLLKDCQKLTQVEFQRNAIRKISPHLFDDLENLSGKNFSRNPCTRNMKRSNLTNCFKKWTDTVNSIENDDRVCGKSMQLQPLAVADPAISQGKYPWIAAFYHHNEFHCGSSLISGKHILLAAHCIHNKRSTPKDPNDCKFALGKFNLTADEDGSLNVKVSKFILHPDWDANSVDYRGDIAVAVLTTIVEFTELIRPICLNEQKLPNFYNKIGTVIGWGATKRNPREGNDVALEVNLKIHETRECLDLDQDLKHLITLQSFCAGNRNNTGSCTGDLEGALIVKDDNRFKAVGVMSASVKTFDHVCDTSKNQIYTEIAAYHDWIMDRVFITY